MRATLVAVGLMAFATFSFPLPSQTLPPDAAWSFGSWSYAASSPTFLFAAPWDPKRVLVVGDRSWIELETPALPQGRWLHWLKPTWFSPEWWRGVPVDAALIPQGTGKTSWLVVLLGGGLNFDATLEVWNARERSLLYRFQLPCPQYSCPSELGWLPASGENSEATLLIGSSRGLEAYRPSGELLWARPDLAANQLKVAQVDGDPGLEIVTTSGAIFDVDSLTVQAVLVRTATSDIATVDLDGDHDEEILAVGGSRFVDVHDGETGAWLQRFGPLHGLDLEKLYVPPAESGKPRIALAGTSPTWFVTAFRLDTGEPLWNLGLGGPVLHFGESLDLDDNGTLDIFFSSNGEIPTRTFGATPEPTGLLLENFHDFVGPVWGDFDRDGEAELVVSASGTLAQSQLLVFDATRHELRYEPQEPGPTVQSLRARDVDGDGRNELLIASGAWTCHPSLLAVELSAGATETVWQAETCDSFTDAEVGDIDGDGQLEVVGKGYWLSVFDGRTGALEWSLPEPYFDTLESEQTGLELADLNGDGTAEILVLGGSRYTQRRLLVVDGRTRRLIQRLVGPFELISTSLDRPPEKRHSFWTWDGTALIEYRQIGLDLRPAQRLPWPYLVSSIVESGPDLWLLGPGSGVVQFRPGQGILWQSGPYDLGGHGRALAFTPGGPHRFVAAGPSALRAFP